MNSINSNLKVILSFHNFEFIFFKEPKMQIIFYIFVKSDHVFNTMTRQNQIPNLYNNLPNSNV